MSASTVLGQAKIAITSARSTADLKVVKPRPNGGRSTVHVNRTDQDYNGDSGTDMRAASAMCHYNIIGRVCDIAINLATRHKPIGALDWQSPSLTTSAAGPAVYALPTPVNVRNRDLLRASAANAIGLVHSEAATLLSLYLHVDGGVTRPA